MADGGATANVEAGTETGRRLTPRIAIVLSAGYFGFFAHAGFMLAIEELGIDYCAIGGSSAGAIVAALHASGVPAGEIIDMLTSVRRRDIWDSTGIGGIARALLRRGRGWTGWLKGNRFEDLMERQLRAKSFEDCPRALYITALNLTHGEDETFTSGTIADKVRASCGYPFLMSPKSLNGCQYWDGGFLAKVPIESILETERPDQVIIHYLTTRTESSRFEERNWSAVALLEQALTAARKEIEQHRLKALGADGGRLIWSEPVVPPIGPNTLSEGRAAVDAAYRQAIDSLSRHRAQLTPSN
jgi:NTE family protein